MHDSGDIFDRLPPSDISAEQCLLASMMLDQDIRSDCLAMVSREAFYQTDHQIIFDVLASLHSRGKPVDAVICRDELAKRQMLEEVGGQAYIGQILHTVPSAAHGASYAKIIIEKFKLRSLEMLANDVLRGIYKPTEDDNADDLAAEFSSRANSIMDNGSADTIRSAKQIVESMLEEKSSGKQNRQSTGLYELDEITGGFPIGGYTIIAADGGIGKSQLCKQIVRNTAEDGIPCGIIAAEESGEKIFSNYLAGFSGVVNSRIIRNTLDETDWPKIWNVAAHVQGLPIFVDDAQRKLSRIESCIRRMVRRHGCRIIVIDHIQLLDGERDRNQNRTQEVDKISKSLKGIFKDLKLVGIVASQVNRTGNPGEPPALTQLRDSGSLVADADVILQLRRLDWFRWKEDQNFQPDHKLEIFVNKNKDGPMGSREFYFDGDRQTVTDWNNGAGPNAPEGIFE